jgi:serine/threonine protein kinase/tetratricopeptide (TPR) repeat protein
VACRSLKRQLLAELRSSWEDGQPITPEDLRNRWPVNFEDDPDVASLLCEDYWQRRQQGQQPTAEEYSCRFPGQKESLPRLLERQAMQRPCGERSAPDSRLMGLPEVGDELFGFRLCQGLGCGAFARVFLAEQKMLAGRQVVVKVSAIDGDEPQTLAQLQHTHIVPIYSCHQDEAAGLRLVCMPHFGGASLARVLEALRAQKALPTHGKQLVAAISMVGSPVSPIDQAAQTDRGPFALLSRVTFVDAATWIIACLAEALQHAHQRHILHHDIKPSNILLCADGQPMLLDFNLAEKFQADRALSGRTVGGTLAYMAPEHLLALATCDPAFVSHVDHRTDLYGLGIVFYELLTGRNPFEHDSRGTAGPAQIEALAFARARWVPSLRRHRPDVPWSLESITRKCLDPDPENRYQHAEHLADDLRRYLEDRPLRYAPELSWRERLAKWRRRHPRLAVSGWMAVAATILLATSTFVLFSLWNRAREGDIAVAQRTKWRFGTDANSARCFLSATVGELSPLKDGLESCERALGRYGVLEHADWQKTAAWQLLGEEDQKELTEDIRELLLLLARARILMAHQQLGLNLQGAMVIGVGLNPLSGNCLAAPGPVLDELKKGLELLDRAYAIGDRQSARAIWEDRAVYHELLGESDEARVAKHNALELQPATARDHYRLGSSFARSGRYLEAIPELEAALDLNGDREDYWSHFYLGMCFRQQGDYSEAVKEFAICTRLRAEFSWGHFNLGEAYHRQGRHKEALAAYSSSLKRKPDIPQAIFNRGLVYLDQGDWNLALDDFNTASNRGCTSEDTLNGLRSIALAHLGRDDEAEAAFAKASGSAWKSLHVPLSYAFAISERHPDDAEQIFRKILELEPLNARACYGRGMLLERVKLDSEEAAWWFDRAVLLHPRFVEARMARSMIRARRGCGEECRDDIDLCLDLESAAPRGRTLYGAACFYALLSEKSGGLLAASWANCALDLLGKAFQQGYGHSKAATDPDLLGIQQHRDFGLLLERAPRPKDPQ